MSKVVGMTKSKKLILLVVLVLVALVAGALAFTSSDYWQSIKDSSASQCLKYQTKCAKNSAGIVECKKICVDNGMYIGPAVREE